MNPLSDFTISAERLLERHLSAFPCLPSYNNNDLAIALNTDRMTHVCFLYDGTFSLLLSALR